jgi:hypothetical protein
MSPSYQKVELKVVYFALIIRACSGSLVSLTVHSAMSAADPVDFEEMAAEQNCCPETQCLLGGTSFKLAFRQTGAQRLAGDVSTGNFCPIVPLKFRKSIFDYFHNVAYHQSG